MSDRIKGLTVTLRPDMRDDDAQHVIEAIRMIKHVVDVEAHVADADHHYAVVAAKHEMRAKISDVIQKVLWD